MSSNAQQAKPSVHDSEVKSAKGETMQPCQDLASYFQQYARERPEVVAMWCFGIGFVLGWRLKPW